MRLNGAFLELGGSHRHYLLHLEVPVLLTEATVEKMFRQLIKDSQNEEAVLDKAEELIEEELRPESPLRHRLSMEIEELRASVAKK